MLCHEKATFKTYLHILSKKIENRPFVMNNIDIKIYQKIAELAQRNKMCSILPFPCEFETLRIDVKI